jgi:hypothetical protein
MNWRKWLTVLEMIAAMLVIGFIVLSALAVYVVCLVDFFGVVRQ